MIDPCALFLALYLAGDSAQLTAIGQEVSAEIGEQELRSHVYRLGSQEFQGRRGAGGARASRYIADAFARAGLLPAFGGSYFQLIPNRAAPESQQDQSFLGRNVGAILPGSDPKLKEEWILLNAHFDHLGLYKGQLYPGADDNASGVAMLIEVAEHFALRKEKPRRTMVFVAFDLEEAGLLGSTYFATHPPAGFGKPKASLTADMVGRSMGDLMHETVYVLGSENSADLRKLIEGTAAPNGLQIARLGADIIGTRSDYGPFRDLRVPFLFFSTGSHLDYHRPSDKPELVDYAKMKRIADYVRSLLARLADDDSCPSWEPKGLPPDLDEVKSIRALLSRLLENPEVMHLTPEQRTMVSAVEERLMAIEKRGKVTVAERNALVWSARLLMASVFQ